MTRHRLAFLAAAAVGALAAPALAQDGPPPPAPGWADPQVPYPGPRMPMVHGADRVGPENAGAPFAPPPPPGAYPGGPPPYPAPPMIHGPMARGPVPPGPMAWGAPGAAYGYAYQYGAGPAPCGCAAYAMPPVMWVPVPIETRYSYSPPIRHEHEVVEVQVTRERVAETVSTPVHHETKYVKSTAPAKYVKEKVVKTTK